MTITCLAQPSDAGRRTPPPRVPQTAGGAAHQHLCPMCCTLFECAGLDCATAVAWPCPQHVGRFWGRA